MVAAKKTGRPPKKVIYKPGTEPGPVTVIDVTKEDIKLHDLKAKDKPPPKER